MASAAVEDESPAEARGGGRARRDRKRRGGGREDYQREVGAAASAGSSSISAPTTSFSEDVQARLTAREEVNTLFVAGDSSFERVVDDEAAVANGEMFKDARLQERLTDQIHAVEFDMETTEEAEVGSLLSSENMSAGGSFERIADDDDFTGDTPRAVETVQPAVKATVSAFVDDNKEDSALLAGRTKSFERVSDDDKAVEGVTSAGGDNDVAATSSARGKPSKARRPTGKSKKVASDSTTGEVSGEATEETAAQKNSRSRATKEAAAKKAPAKGKATATKGGSTRRGGKSKTGEAAAEATTEGNATADAAVEALANSQPLPDAEAGVKTRRARNEFARRGGRRRNRRPGGAPGENGGNAGENSGEADRSNGESEEVVEPVELEASPVVEEVQEARPEPRAETRPDARPDSRPEPRGRQPRGGRNERGERGEHAPRPERGGGAERSERTDSARSDASGGRSDGGGGRSDGGGGGRSSGGGRDRHERHTPLITDLLREGQEILVQIAKEPIAAKGARITSHIALPGRFLVYMPTVEHVGVSRKIESDSERVRLRKLIQNIRQTEDVPSGGFIVRTAGIGISEEDLRDDARYLVRTWLDIRRAAEKQKAPTLTHKDLDLVQRILRDQLSDDFAAIRVDSEEEYQNIVEFINRIQPRLVKRVKLYTREEPILEAFGVQVEIDKAIKPRVWLKSGGYLVINQTEALVAIDVNTGKFVGRGGTRLEDTITRTNMEAVDEIARQIRLRDLGGIIVLDLIDMEDRRNRNRVMGALQDALRDDKSPTKVLSFNDFGLVIMTRKRVKQSLERTLCSPCPYCVGAGLVKSPQTVCYEILEESRTLSRGLDGDVKQATLRVNPEVAQALRSTERDVYAEIEEYLG
ncbi:MAG: Rne/Rng family ribonuclease, partial [Acidobacteriota bacterium]|nr:Rne/Rng family ribonuclease [Acidobacteriota bacterium]